MLNKKIIFMAILLVSLLSLSAVSAAEDVASDILDESIIEDVSNDELVLDEPVGSGEDEPALGDEGNAGTFHDLNEAINGNEDSTITLTKNYAYNGVDDYDSDFKEGIVINRPVEIYGNGITIDGSNMARIFYVNATDVSFHDINFINGYSEVYGGAIGQDASNIYTAINCTFTQNNAQYGGAIAGGNATNCTFTQNNAQYGGAMCSGIATNCTFTQNTATSGGAIADGNVSNCTFIKNIASENGGALLESNATNCTFIKNTALFGGGAIYKGEVINCTFIENIVDSTFILSGGGGAISDGAAINCTFNGNDALIGGAIYRGEAINCTFTQNTATYGGAILMGNAIDCTFTQNTAEWGGAIFDCDAINCTFTQNTAKYGGAMNSGNATNCTFILNFATEEGNDVIGLVTNNCKFIVPEFIASDFKTAYNSGEKFTFKLDADGQVLDGVKTIISIYKNGAFVANYTALSGEGWTVKLTPGTYQAVLSISNSNVEAVTKTITVTKAPTAITASAVTATYNVNKYLTIKLTDANGKALSGVKVTVTLGTAKTYTTDKNGQIKINVAKLVPKTYTAKIAYAGNANYLASTKSVKVVVKKASPKMTAKAKSFKVSVKTKKYTITLKNNKGAVMKKVKLTLKINKKTFKATTNSKGVATFKITNLKKKGKFTATIKYAGNKYYNKLSKKAKITVK